MKYFVAHLLTGDARHYHERLTRELSDRFRIAPLHARVPPHVTIKIPFEADAEEIRHIERTLRAFAGTRTATELILKGFGHFGFRTIYLDAYKSADSVTLVRECLRSLREGVPWLPFGPLEGNKLHASVARFLSRGQFKRVWKLLDGVHPHFPSSLDNIAIMKKEGPRWVVHTTITLPHAVPSPDAALTVRSKSVLV